jgi:hypothetical protein
MHGEDPRPRDLQAGVADSAACPRRSKGCLDGGDGRRLSLGVGAEGGRLRQKDGALSVARRPDAGRHIDLLASPAGVLVKRLLPQDPTGELVGLLSGLGEASRSILSPIAICRPSTLKRSAATVGLSR